MKTRYYRWTRSNRGATPSLFYNIKNEVSDDESESNWYIYSYIRGFVECPPFDEERIKESFTPCSEEDAIKYILLGKEECIKLWRKETGNE